MEQANLTVRKRKVVPQEYISRAPREDNMLLVDASDVPLHVPESSAGPAMLVKDLAAGCGTPSTSRHSSQDRFAPLTWKIVFTDQGICRYGKVIERVCVARVVVSTHPGFEAGDIVSGMTGWEEYSLIDKPD